MDEVHCQLSTGHDLENPQEDFQPNDTSKETKNVQENAPDLEKDTEGSLGTSVNDSTHENSESDNVERKAATEVKGITATEEDIMLKNETPELGAEAISTIKEGANDKEKEEDMTQKKDSCKSEVETIQEAKQKDKDDVCKDGKCENGEATFQVVAKGDGVETASEDPVSAVKEKTSLPPRKETSPRPSQATSREKQRQERKTDLPRSRTMPRSHGAPTRKDIAEKFGGMATSGVRVQRSTSCGASAVKNMLLEWCRAKTRNREGVDIQNFSSSWNNGLAFCALILAFFPDEFDFDALDPKNRRENFQLAFSTAERLADCPPLLDVEDMVRMKVPDSKCVYTYVQELYRSLVAKGLVKTKKV